jgi:hypothetical protein
VTWKKGESGNPAGRKKGTNHKSASTAAVIRQWGSLEKFFDDLAVKAKEGCAVSRKELLARIEPPLKSVAATVRFAIDATKPATAAKSILEAVAAGELPPDTGAQLIASVARTTELELMEEMLDRIIDLEKQHAKDSRSE